jgi:transmembrane sensor
MKKPDNTYQILIVRYLSKECSDQERTRLEQWFSESDENRKVFDQFQKLWELKPEQPEVFFDKPKALENIESRIRLAEGSVIKPAPARKQRLFRLYAVSSIAALLLIVFGIYALFFQQRQPDLVHFIAGVHAFEALILPDSSKVYLKGGSSVTYPERFVGKERWITVEGEAFFEVAHLPEKPFVVSMDETEVRVLGTEFNISFRPGNNCIEVAVVKGKVLFMHARQQHPQVVLNAGEKGIYSKPDQTMVMEKISDQNFLAWKTGILQFDQTPLDVVFKTLEETYQIRVRTETGISGLKLTARFDNDKPEDIFTTLNLLFGFETEKVEETYIIR